MRHSKSGYILSSILIILLCLLLPLSASAQVDYYARQLRVNNWVWNQGYYWQTYYGTVDAFRINYLGTGGRIFDLQADSSTVFDLTKAGDLGLIGAYTLTAPTQGSYTGITITPAGPLSASAVFKGIEIDGDLLDPAVSLTTIAGFKADFKNVDLTNPPHMMGVWVQMPLTYTGQAHMAGVDVSGNGMAVRLIDNEVGQNAIYVYGGSIQVDYELPNTAEATFQGLAIDLDVSSLAASSLIHAIEVQAVGATSGEVTAIGTYPGVAILHQHIGTFVTPSQTEYAARWPSGGAWTDGIDGNQIFVADNDAILIGSPTMFDALEVILTTGASKDVFAEYFYRNTGDTWVEFSPGDGTGGFQNDGDIVWDSDSFTNWKSDYDPGGAQGSPGYYINITRTRNQALSATALPTTIKILTPTNYGWDENADVTMRNLTATGTASAHVLGSGGNTFSFDPGSGPTYAGTARPTRTLEIPVNLLHPDPDGTENSVTVTDNYDATNHRGFWRCVSRSATQDYRYSIDVKVPDDFSAFTGSNSVSIDVRSSDNANCTLTLTMLTNADAADATINGTDISPSADNAWQTKQAEPGSAYSAGQWMKFRIFLGNDDIDDSADIARIFVSYLASN